MSILFFLCFVLKSGKYSYTQIFLEECKYRIKKKIVIKSVIKDDLKSSSSDESEEESFEENRECSIMTF